MNTKDKELRERITEILIRCHLDRLLSQLNELKEK